jgi:molybdopterin synthase catalytic subunit
MMESVVDDVAELVSTSSSATTSTSTIRPTTTNISVSDTKSSEHNDENQSYEDEDYMIAISNVLPTLDVCYQFVANDPSCGAVSTFVGITRNYFDDKQVLSLRYEAYVPMALKELLKLCKECKMDQYTSIRRIAAVHVIGNCPVGQASVILACSSPHRKDAIQGCEYLINQLKARIPIWKQEVYVDDPNSVWKENIEWFHNNTSSTTTVERDNNNNNEDSSNSKSVDIEERMYSRRIMRREQN